ncbi:putative metalloprotease 1 [Diplodia seriata]|uniref:Putative metalloprotease 1 n=1 Tax=Diplodia seriata TaxID=420778 RepID=A0A0G2DQU8_9PEZI|nr:putative metalloprotease 1 [Diplodia seriata]
MLTKIAFRLGLLAFLVGAAAAKPRCTTPDPPSELLASVAEKKVKDADIMRAKAPITIDAWFHVVAASDAVEDANITNAMVQDQLEVLNANFAPHDISFTLLGTTRTINSTWSDNTDILSMKTELRKGDYATLNLYFTSALPGDSSGYCTFPGTVENGTVDFFNDGCVLDAQTVPGGTKVPYNEGKTATHEVGHWLGLYHTFQGGCNGGDGIDDTPAQATRSEGCPVGRDSCPDSPGLDPIHNYMDYSDE